MVSLVAGGCAGTVVDVTLFPIDTIKTRLQSPNGFWKAGGFRGIYNGLGAATLGSAPGAALFFTTYEVNVMYHVFYHCGSNIKNLLTGLIVKKNHVPIQFPVNFFFSTLSYEMYISIILYDCRV